MNRERFPGLNDEWARLDGPAGTQMVGSAIDAMADWMRSGHGANSGGQFAAAIATDELVASTRATVGALFDSEPEGVAIGPSMTAMAFRMAGALARTLRSGDEIVVTRLDHDANVMPWVAAAERCGAVVRFADPVRDTLELGVERVEAVLSARTRWVAVTAASNLVGTVTPVADIAAAAHAHGARVFVDAVHAAPHRRLSRRAIGADVLATSPYKWFGPHAGLLVADPALLAELRPDKVRPASDAVPQRWEQGTPSFEAIAGIRAAAEYLLSLDWDAVRAHEDGLIARTLAGLDAIDGLTVHGRAADRTPTVLFTLHGTKPAVLAAKLAETRIATWQGNSYALELSARLGLEPQGGVRAGFVHYNTAAEADRLLAAVSALAARPSPV